MSKFVVWSTHPEPEPHDVVESTRTDRKVAEEDAAIFREIFHRKSWIQEESK